MRVDNVRRHSQYILTYRHNTIQYNTIQYNTRKEKKRRVTKLGKQNYRKIQKKMTRVFLIYGSHFKLSLSSQPSSETPFISLSLSCQLVSLHSRYQQQEPKQDKKQPRHNTSKKIHNFNEKRCS